LPTGKKAFSFNWIPQEENASLLYDLTENDSLGIHHFLSFHLVVAAFSLALAHRV
jgi:hypothetical protein